MIGAVLGGVLGQLIPWDMKGIDFCMTALFVIIFIDQWEKTDKHTPALAGCGIGIICLLIFGASSFMLPALLITSGLLVVLQKKGGGSINEYRKNIDHDHSFRPVYLFPPCLALSGF